MGKDARYVSLAIFVVALCSLFMTFGISVGPTSDPVEIYLRNFSTIGALVVLALFFDIYVKLHLPRFENSSIKSMKTTSFILVLACALKIVISSVYLVKYFSYSNIIFLYYLGEVVVWAAVGAFVLNYRRHVKNKERKSYCCMPDSEEIHKA